MAEKTRFFQYNRLVILPLIVLFVAVGWGSVSAGLVSGDAFEGLSGYLNSFFKQIPDRNLTMLYSALKKNILIWIIISLAGGVMPAFVLTVATVWERGFVIGYTSASFYKVYGLKGILPCVALLPEMVVFLPVLIIFSSISLKMSFFSHENKKVFLGKYVFFVLIFLSVFCVVSCFQTFLTTIFMKCASYAL